MVLEAAKPERIKEKTKKINLSKNKKAINNKRKFKFILSLYLVNIGCKNPGISLSQLLSFDMVNSINGSNDRIPIASKMLDIKRKKTKTKKNLGDMLNKDLINFSCVIFSLYIDFSCKY